MTERKFDIIIIGAGVSGLILADEITKRTNKKILLIEKNKRIIFDKNLCFWSTPSNVLTMNADNKWERMCVIINGRKIFFKNEGIKYLQIKSKSLFSFFLKRLKKRKNFKILMGQNLVAVNIKNDSSEIITKDNIFKSSLLFDSRVDENYQKSKKLLQHFYGVEIQFEEKTIDKDEITLMDIQKNKNNFNFIYVLPFSEKKMLVETTYFSNRLLSETDYKKDLDSYMLKNFSGKKYKINFSESGIIPMFKIKEKNTSNYIKIGTAGNWIKQSSGYSLQNSFMYSKQIVDCIIKGKSPKIKKNLFLNFLDQTFCNFLLNHPEKSALFFENFFERNSLSTIVKFLTDTSNFFDTLKIISTLPKVPLIKSIFASK